MDKETALQAWKQMRSEIDPDNWLFVGTINLEMVDRAIEALEAVIKADANLPEIPDSWIPVKAHLATDEEQESRPDIDYWFDCEMPDDEQEILVTVKHKNWLSVEKDVCYVDSCYGLDSGYDWLDDIIAWMPLPEPWKGE